LKENVEKLEKEIKEKDEYIQKIINEDQQKRINELELQLVPLQQQVINQQNYIQSLQTQLQTAKLVDEQQKLNQAKIQVLEKRISELLNEINNKDNAISELEADNADMMDIISKLEMKLKQATGK